MDTARVPDVVPGTLAGGDGTMPLLVDIPTVPGQPVARNDAALAGQSPTLTSESAIHPWIPAPVVTGSHV